MVVPLMLLSGDPGGDRLTECQRGREAGAVAAASHPQARNLGHRPGDEAPVWTHGEQAAPVLSHRNLTRDRDLGRDLVGELRWHRQIKRHIIGAEPGRLGARVHRQRVRLKPADHQAASGRPQIYGRVDDSHDRVGRGDLASRLGDEQLMPHRRDSYPAAGQLGHLPGPGPGRIHHCRSPDGPLRGLHPGNPAAGQRDARDRLGFKQFDTVQPAGRHVSPH
jgi:hypothetical protein